MDKPDIMYQFMCCLDDEECKQTELATTPGKAKYQYYQYLQDGIWEVPFETFVKHVRCKKVGKANIDCLFDDKQSFERMCKNRGIPFAYQGMKIEVAGKVGTITGSYGMNLHVVFQGSWIPSNCHPWWETRYFDESGAVIKDYVTIKDGGVLV